ncbi:MAG: peptidase S8, partial [Thermoanaerobaculia bacterium]|nr:peptidase S8 [Thermoanaerobaculia bacterium]
MRRFLLRCPSWPASAVSAAGSAASSPFCSGSAARPPAPRISTPVASTGAWWRPSSPASKPRASPSPTTRTLRVFSFDPSLGLEVETAALNRTRVDIPWEELRPGPVGNYLEVVDVDPASDCAYAPVDLNDPRILALQGLEPSEGNPQFHQQMVYAVAMKTIQNFERALGRVALWSPRRTRTRSGDGWSYRDDFVPRLRIYPHALREANAFYSPERKALLFGYFPASRTDAGRNLPGGVVFTCLSHDIVAHETTHALLDGLHRRFAEPSNLDVYAFHEAFADIVALFQHFSFAEALHHQIAKTRGDLAQQNLLGQLAQQFGEAMGRRGALRDALGKIDKETGKWQSAVPDPDDYLTVEEPHARGAILVAAIFDAFLTIFKHRVRDLMRIATGGTGVLPEGAIHPDLTARLAREAAKTAQHVLTISIRALDYCPPVDITFGEYLRALITADSDLIPDDSHGYRIAFIEAFRRRGIYPERVRALSVDSLRWHSPASLERLGGLDELLSKLDLSWDLGSERYKAYQQSQDNCKEFHRWAREHLFPHPEQRKEMGLAWGDDAPALIWKKRDGEVATEVHSVRRARLNPTRRSSRRAS